MVEPYEARKRLSFKQAEGVEPLPSQLKLKEVSKELRAQLWRIFHASLMEHFRRASFNDGAAHFTDPWYTILFDKHVMYDHAMVDEYMNDAEYLISQLKPIFSTGSYVELFDFIQWVLRHHNCPDGLSDGVSWALEYSRAAYAVFDVDTIIPIGSPSESETLKRAFADLEEAEFRGARAHLRKAGTALTGGEYAESIRDSVHAIESVARMLDPSAKTLDPALAKLAKSANIHPALKSGFGKLYGFTSDEKGIRHALLDEPTAAVDEADALYMLGACAAFVSYLINKARKAGLLTKKRRSTKKSPPG